MKNIIVKALILIGAPLILVKTGSAQNTQSLSEFNRIKLEDNIEAELVITDRYSLTTELPNEIIAKVEDKELVVKRKSPDNNNKLRVKVKIFTRGLTGIKLDGATRLTTQSTVVSDQLSIDIDGAARASLVVKVKKISIDMDGAASLEIKGSTTSAVIDADGAAKLRAIGMSAESVTVDADGAASVHVNVTETLNVKADGASAIRYSGEPKDKTTVALGSSSVKKLESNGN